MRRPKASSATCRFTGAGVDAQPRAKWRGVTTEKLDQVAGGQPEVGGHGGRHAQDAVPAEPALVRIALVGGDGKRRRAVASRARSACVAAMSTRAIRCEDHSVSKAGPLPRDISRANVVTNAVGLARERIAETAAARRLHDHDIAGSDERTPGDLARRRELDLGAVVATAGP